MSCTPAGTKRLYHLFAYDHRSDLGLQDVWICSDCHGIFEVRVKPYWRHLFERIKQRIDPNSPAHAGSEQSKKQGKKQNAEAWCMTEDADPVDKPAVTEKIPRVHLNEFPSEPTPESKSTSELDPHGYPATISIRSDCVYAKHEGLCMDCWLHYWHTGIRRPPQDYKRRFIIGADDDHSLDDKSPCRDDLSEDEYPDYVDDVSENDFSPYMIYS